MIYMGIDPGASGGIAVVDADGGLEFCQALSGLTPADLLDAVCHRTRDAKVVAVLEKVGGYVGDGGNPGSRMFAFGANYGQLQMALTAACIPFREVVPRSWQKALGIAPRGKSESKAAWKRRLKGESQKRFPGAKLTLATADAALIAEYCRRTA